MEELVRKVFLATCPDGHLYLLYPVNRNKQSSLIDSRPVPSQSVALMSPYLIDVHNPNDTPNSVYTGFMDIQPGTHEGIQCTSVRPSIILSL